MGKTHVSQSILGSSFQARCFRATAVVQVPRFPHGLASGPCFRRRLASYGLLHLFSAFEELLLCLRPFTKHQGLKHELDTDAVDCKEFPTYWWRQDLLVMSLVRGPRARLRF